MRSSVNFIQRIFCSHQTLESQIWKETLRSSGAQMQNICKNVALRVTAVIDWWCLLTVLCWEETSLVANSGELISDICFRHGTRIFFF